MSEEKKTSEEAKRLFLAVKEAREEHEAILRQVAVAEKLRRKAEQRLIDHMLKEGYPRFDHDKFTALPIRNFSAKVNKETYHQAIEWLQETLGDTSDYVSESVDRYKVLDLLKERYENGDPIPDFFEAKPSVSLRINGWEK